MPGEEERRLPGMPGPGAALGRAAPASCIAHIPTAEPAARGTRGSFPLSLFAAGLFDLCAPGLFAARSASP